MKKPILLFTAIFHFFIFTSLHSQVWELKNPRAGIENLNAINFYNSDIGVACGEQSQIHVTTDGGNSWTEVDDGTDNRNFTGVHYVKNSNGDQIIVYGNSGGSISLDRGLTFNSFGQNLSNMQSLSSTESGNLYANTLQYGIYKSGDLGDSWEQIYIPEDLSYRGYGAYFFDDNNGLVIDNEFDANTLRRTEDGGVTWTIEEELFEIYPQNIHFINNLTGSFTSNEGVHLTIDGGETWDIINGPTSGGVEEVSILDNSTFTILLSNGNLNHTQDGGSTWTTQENYPVPQTAIDVIDENLFFTVGNSNSILYNFKYGETIEDRLSGYKYNVSNVVMASNTDGYALSSYPFNLLKTTNKGETWNVVYTEEDLSLSTTDIVTFGENTVYISSFDGLLKSNDGGSSFTMVYDDNTVRHLKKTADDQFLIIDNATNFIFSDPQFNNTSVVYTELYGINDLAITDNGLFWASTNDGVFTSSDQGESWDEKYTSTNHLEEIEQVSEQSFFVLEYGYSGQGYLTEDNGENWENIEMPVNFYKSDLLMTGDNVGYISGGVSSTGTILKTVDGCKTWEVVHNERVTFSELSKAVDGSNDLWVGGSGGYIGKYIACKGPQIIELEIGNNNCINEIVTISATAEYGNIFEWETPEEWEVESFDQSGNLYVIPSTPSGEVTVSVQNECGSDVATQSITVDVFDTPTIEISQEGNTLICNVEGQEYEWYRDGNYIAGAFESEYRPTQDGNYSVLVYFTNGCDGESESFNFMITSIEDTQLQNIKVYPNPARNSLNIDHLPADATIYIYDITGQEILTTSSNYIDTQSLNRGMYLMKIKTDIGSINKIIAIK